MFLIEISWENEKKNQSRKRKKISRQNEKLVAWETISLIAMFTTSQNPECRAINGYTRSPLWRNPHGRWFQNQDMS